MNDLKVHWFALSSKLRNVILQKIIRIYSYVNYLIKNSFSKFKTKVNKTTLESFY